MAMQPRPPRRPSRSGGEPPAADDPQAPRASSLLLGMLVVALIGLAFAMAITLVSATG